MTGKSSPSLSNSNLGCCHRRNSWLISFWVSNSDADFRRAMDERKIICEHVVHDLWE